MPTKAVKKNRIQWAADIRAAHKQIVQKTIEGVFKIGRMLIAAKAALEHGEFEKMIESNLPFDASTAQRLMKIARDPRLQKAARAQVLPMAWSTLYELTKLDDEAFKQAVTSGAIHRQTTRSDAVAIVRGPTRSLYTVPPEAMADLVAQARNIVVRSPSHTISPVYRAAQEPTPTVEHADDDAPAHDHQPDLPTLDQIERLVDALQTGVERGDVTVDTDFSERAQRIVEQLQAMVGSGRRH
jgi:hypothetical protein